MGQIDDNKIIKWIQKQDYSSLAFLDNYWRSPEKEQSPEKNWYLGFCYFLKYLKNKDAQDTKDVFDVIVSRTGCESSGYYYLGQTARRIYNSFGTNHIAACKHRPKPAHICRRFNLLLLFR